MAGACFKAGSHEPGSNKKLTTKYSNDSQQKPLGATIHVVRQSIFHYQYWRGEFRLHHRRPDDAILLLVFQSGVYSFKA